MACIRENLIESISSTEYGNSSLIGNNFQKGFIEKIADHIISSGFIEELQNEAYDLGVDSALHNHFGLSWEDAAGLRKEIKNLQEATRWIPVSERLPELERTVLVIDRVTGEITTAHLNDFNSFVFRDGRGHGASYWMPLPKPPKED